MVQVTYEMYTGYYSEDAYVYATILIFVNNKRILHTKQTNIQQISLPQLKQATTSVAVTHD